MKKCQRTTIFFLLFLCLPSIWAASTVDGDWIGGFERAESRVFVHAHFGTTNSETTGTIDVVDLSINTGSKTKSPDVWISKFGYVPNTCLIGKPLAKLELTSLHMHFELADKDSPMSFDGPVANSVMNGVMEDCGMKLPFHLYWMTKIDPSEYTGNYQVGPGHFIRISPAWHVPSLLSFDTQSGQIRVLLPRSGADFVSGPEYDTFSPVDVAVHFIANPLGQFTTLQWKPENAPALVGTRIKALPEDEVSFTNGNVTSLGTVVLPPTKGPHPAVVIVNGSGPWVRSSGRDLAEFFALNGVAALIYDKRGCGRSTGSWNESSFDDLAGDALAGLELLKNRPDINPHQIGLEGGSQGGWIVSLAASRLSSVSLAPA
jgi:hypothetical protein